MNAIKMVLKCSCGKVSEHDPPVDKMICPLCGKGYFAHLTKFEPHELKQTDEPTCIIEVEQK